MHSEHRFHEHGNIKTEFRRSGNRYPRIFIYTTQIIHLFLFLPYKHPIYPSKTL